jgi:transcriptional regulator with XRE-family HTH domain
MSQEELFINGELLRLRREAKGWVLNDMATRACMSVKQIRQLEEGGMSSFYSVAVKVTAAKKVGALLGLSAEEVFAQNADLASVEDLSESEPLIAEVAAEPETASQAADVFAVPAQDDSKPEHIEPVVVKSSETTESKDETPNSKNTLWLIPPADVVDPASAASAADTPASTADAVAPASAAVSPQKPASTAALSPVAVNTAASSPALVAPSASTASKAP